MGLFWKLDGRFGSLRSYFLAYGGYFGTLEVHVGVTLGWLWGTLGFVVTLVPCAGHFWHMEVPLGSLGPLWDHVGPLWEHRGITIWVMKVALGDVGVALGPF